VCGDRFGFVGVVGELAEVFPAPRAARGQHDPAASAAEYRS